MLDYSKFTEVRFTMTGSHGLTASLEDYLEAIGWLVVRKGEARSKDIAEAVSVHISTVTTALRKLSEKRLINYSPYQPATLTEEGRRVANRIVGRHEDIRSFLTEILLVDKEVAEENACRMEHVLDEQVMEHLALFAEFVKECPRAGDDWLNRFEYFLEHGGRPPEDGQAMKQWLREFRQKVDERDKGGKGEQDRMVTLDELKSGQRAKIVKVGGGGPVRRRIVDMGAVKGTPVEVVKVAPLGDPIEIKIKGYSLTLRKEEAARITVKPQ